MGANVGVAPLLKKKPFAAEVAKLLSSSKKGTL